MKKVELTVKNCYECPYFSFSKFCDLDIGLISCYCNLSKILPKCETLNIDFDTCDHEVHIQCPMKLLEINICLTK